MCSDNSDIEATENAEKYEACISFLNLRFSKHVFVIFNPISCLEDIFC